MSPIPPWLSYVWWSLFLLRSRMTLPLSWRYTSPSQNKTWQILTPLSPKSCYFFQTAECRFRLHNTNNVSCPPWNPQQCQWWRKQQQKHQHHAHKVIGQLCACFHMRMDIRWEKILILILTRWLDNRVLAILWKRWTLDGDKMLQIINWFNSFLCSSKPAKAEKAKMTCTGTLQKVKRVYL